MSLPSGTWITNVNGTQGDLVLNAVPDGAGHFAGSVLGTPIKGFWDRTSQTITFWILLPIIGDFPAIAIFKGYLFRTPLDPGHVVTTLTGFVQANNTNGFPPAFGETMRNVFGWFAHIREDQ